jgi:beta-galactosidase GanA
VRWQGERPIHFVLNHTSQKQQVNLKRRMQDLLTGNALESGTVELPPYQVLILAAQSTEDETSVEKPASVYEG